MHGKIQPILIDPTDDVLNHVPLIDSDETFEQPKSEVVVHFLTKGADLFLFGNLRLQLLLIGLLIHDRLEKVRILILNELDLPLNQNFNFIELILLSLLKVAKMRPNVFNLNYLPGYQNSAYQAEPFRNQAFEG